MAQIILPILKWSILRNTLLFLWKLNNQDINNLFTIHSTPINAKACVGIGILNNNMNYLETMVQASLLQPNRAPNDIITGDMEWFVVATLKSQHNGITSGSNGVKK